MSQASAITYWEDRRRILKQSQQEGEVRLWIEHKRVRVSAPIDPDFQTGAAELGGRFKARSGLTWSFYLSQRPQVEALIEQTFGKGSIIVGAPEFVVRARSLLCRECKHEWEEAQGKTTKRCPKCLTKRIAVVLDMQD